MMMTRSCAKLEVALSSVGVMCACRVLYSSPGNPHDKQASIFDSKKNTFVNKSIC